MNIQAGFKIVMARKNISVLDIVRKLGGNRSTVYKAIGADSDPRLSTLIKYCGAIGCTVEELIIESKGATK